MHKAKGQVREVYRTRDMRSLIGTMGLGHVRYATHGNAASEEEAQPFYVNAPYGIILAHNGNLTNTRELTQELFHVDRRHLNTSSDTELLVNVLANELQEQVSGSELDPDQIFNAISGCTSGSRGRTRPSRSSPGTGCSRSATRSASVRSCSAAARRASSGMTGSSHPSPWRSRAPATNSCATSSRAKPFSSRRTAS